MGIRRCERKREEYGESYCYPGGRMGVFRERTKKIGLKRKSFPSVLECLLSKWRRLRSHLDFSQSRSIVVVKKQIIGYN